MALHKGDIVLVQFPFSDLSQTKLRPALVLAVSKTIKVRVTKIITLERKLILRKIGKLGKEQTEILNQTLITAFDLD